MGMRTNAVLTALNYFLDRKMEQEKQKREDERKLRNTEAMLRLQNDIAEYYNPGQRESREWANKASAGKNKNIVSNLADEDMLTKLNNSNAINDALFQQEINPISQDLTRKNLNYKLANIDQRQELESGKLAKDLDDLNYEILNKDKIRNYAARKGELSLQLLAEQVANARANRDLINMKAKAADENAAIRKMLAENKINGGIRASLRNKTPEERLKLKAEINEKIVKMRKDYYDLGIEDTLENDPSYQNYLDIYDELERLDQESLNSSKLSDLVKGVGQTIKNKISPYYSLIEKGLDDYESSKKEKAKVGNSRAITSSPQPKFRLQDRRFR